MSAARLLLIGPGRLGAAILRRLQEEPSLQAVGVVGRRREERDFGVPYFSDLRQALERGGPDVVIDAAPGEGLGERLESVGRVSCAYVLGTTGYPPPLRGRLEALAQSRAVVFAPNFSPGIVVLERWIQDIQQAVSDGVWHASILDRHHRQKTDRPSGTAKALAAALWGDNPGEVVSLRQGEVVGEHRVFLSGAGEELTLTHRVTDRAVFARGACLAAAFAHQAEPGWWTMAHVLGLAGP